MSEFNNNQVKRVSEFLQSYMKKNEIDSMTADQCADLLAENKILPNNTDLKVNFWFN